MSSAPAISPTVSKKTSSNRRLIINADDFGFNREITDGIVESHLNGVVTSTTLMINMPAAEYAVERAADCPEMSIGLHVNLTAGKPVSDPSEVPSLVGPDGNFHDHQTFFRRANLCQFNSAELELEMRRQLEKIHRLGLTPTHADSHHHAASCVQPFFIKLNLLKEFGIRRMRTHRGWYRSDPCSPNRFATLMKTLKTNLRRAPFRMFYEVQHMICRWRGIHTPSERYGFGKVVSPLDMRFDMECVESFLQAMPRGVNELCCHPGYLSEDPLDEPEFRVVRPQELEFFTNDDLRKALNEANVELIRYDAF